MSSCDSLKWPFSPCTLGGVLCFYWKFIHTKWCKRAYSNATGLRNYWNFRKLSFALTWERYTNYKKLLALKFWIVFLEGGLFPTPWFTSESVFYWGNHIWTNKQWIMFLWVTWNKSIHWIWRLHFVSFSFYDYVKWNTCMCAETE